MDLVDLLAHRGQSIRLENQENSAKIHSLIPKISSMEVGVFHTKGWVSLLLWKPQQSKCFGQDISRILPCSPTWCRNVIWHQKSPRNKNVLEELREKRDFCTARNILACGDHPNFEKNAPRIWAEILASNQFRESLRELLRE